MPSNNPLISIGMPVYDGARTIQRAIDSLLRQTYENFEIIISDNGSTDATSDICIAYSNRDDRIRYYRNDENSGAIWNFNRVFDLACGDYFMWASCDDFWEPEYIEACLGIHGQSERIALVGTACNSIDPVTNQLKLIDGGFSTDGLDARHRFIRYKSIIHKGNHVGGIFYGIYKKEYIRKVLPMQPIIAADHLVLAELSLNGHIITLSDALMTKRWGGASRSIKSIAATIGLKNQLLILFPYLMREYHLQRIIYKCNELTGVQKVKLSFWSAVNYFHINLIKGTMIRLKMKIKKLLLPSEQQQLR